jgi:hypothetical protein
MKKLMKISLRLIKIVTRKSFKSAPRGILIIFSVHFMRFSTILFNSFFGQILSFGNIFLKMVFG